MTNERLEQLLRRADGGGDVPVVDGTLADRVRARAKRQQRIRAVGGGVVAAACFIALVGWVMRPDAPPASPAPTIVRATSSQDPSPDAPATDLRSQMLVLSREADRRAAAAEALWAAEPSSPSSPRRTASFATTDVAAQVERAAFTMVYQAARMPAAPAAAVYREVSRTFPEAPSAQVARERLTALETRKDG